MENHNLDLFVTDLFQLKKTNSVAAEKAFQGLTFEQQVEVIKNAPTVIAREILFLSKDAREILKLIPKQKFGEMSLQEYLEDSLIIFSNCTSEQFSYSIDIDLWKKGEIDQTRFLEWVEVIKEIPGFQFRALTKNLDINLLSICLAKYIEVNLEADELILMEHLERNHQYSMQDISIDNAEIEGFVLYIYSAAPEFFSHLLRNIIMGDSQEVLNEARGERDDRLSKEKMPSFEDSQTIYTKLSDFDSAFLHASKHLHSSSTEIQSTDINRVKSYFESVRNHSEYAILLLPKKDTDIIRSLANVTNCVIVADGISPSDDFKYREAIKKAHHIFNIGLEFVSESDPLLAIAFIKEHTAIEIFQIGFTLLMQIKERATTILHDEEELVARYSKLNTMQLRFMEQDIPMVYMESEKRGRTIINLKDVLFLHSILNEIEDLRKEIN